ncbi:hypothetical protein Anapl_00077 [Anas platyrhynchos]|uniref:Secreted protein n=1 Tax=Anas platyrhynchos TaxID=8839 RepID=R0K2J3_ANAPL|nr:hypothetical protein Anapl_00077 [Anas platyrhynchos]
MLLLLAAPAPILRLAHAVPAVFSYPQGVAEQQKGSCELAGGVPVALTGVPFTHNLFLQNFFTSNPFCKVFWYAFYMPVSSIAPSHSSYTSPLRQFSVKLSEAYKAGAWFLVSRVHKRKFSQAWQLLTPRFALQITGRYFTS